jgi:hypothetical protein
MKLIQKVTDILSVPVGYVWESELERASLVRLVLFSLITGDWNKFHANPFTSFLYKSNLRGLTYPGNLVLSITEKGIYRALPFEENTETIAASISSKFELPLRVWSSFRYRYTLLHREIAEGNGKGIKTKCKCTWRIEVLNKRGKLLCDMAWMTEHKPVEESAAGKIFLPVIRAGRKSGKILAYASLLLFLGFYGKSTVWWFTSYTPPNEYAFPIAP